MLRSPPAAGRQAIEAASAQFAASDDFVQSVDEAPLGQQLDELADRLDDLEAKGSRVVAEDPNNCPGCLR